jgi:hypothetical protein
MQSMGAKGPFRAHEQWQISSSLFTAQLYTTFGDGVKNIVSSPQIADTNATSDTNDTNDTKRKDPWLASDAPYQSNPVSRPSNGNEAPADSSAHRIGTASCSKLSVY